MIDEEAKEWLDYNELSYTIWDKKYRYKNESFKDWLKRVSGGNHKIQQLIKDKKFLFGGRTLANRGIPNSGSFSNCYSIGFVPDSLDGIMDVASKIAMTFKAQGGQGLSLSKIRPKGALIANQFKSDGIVPFMNIFNTVTESVMQGGSRKGALMMSINAWHPEAETFIKIKEDLNKINKANLSLEIDNKFMNEVCNTDEDKTYYQYNPDYSVNPKKIFNTLCESAWRSAEPGIIFTDRFRNYNLMEFVDDYQIETCNPCGEQPLPKNGACNLCSINVSEYVINPYKTTAYIDFKSLDYDVGVIVLEMDKVLEENINRHALEEQKEMARKWRNLGIGLMGLADMLVKLGIKYGSYESVKICKELMKFIFRRAVQASALYASVKGNFPGYNPKIWDSEIIKNAFTEEEIIKLKKQNTLRNCSLLSIAPTGSIGTMFNISTGIEPFFALSYNRRTESLESKTFKINIKAVDEYKKVHGDEKLPEYFITSQEIPWKQRIDVQAALQEFCDTAISSTVNLPKDVTVDDVKNLYVHAWKSGCKGITIYRDGSREGILTTETDIKSTKVVNKRPEELPASCFSIKIKGKQFIIAVGLLDGVPYEVFAFKVVDYINIPDHQGVIKKISKGHYSLNSDFFNIDNLVYEMEPEEQAVTLYCSMLMRHGIDMEYIIKTTKKVNGYVNSFSSAICRVLAKYIDTKVTGKCPNCGKDLIYEAGCIHCSSCEYSKCE